MKHEIENFAVLNAADAIAEEIGITDTSGAAAAQFRAWVLNAFERSKTKRGGETTEVRNITIPTKGGDVTLLCRADDVELTERQRQIIKAAMLKCADEIRAAL